MSSQDELDDLLNHLPPAPQRLAYSRRNMFIGISGIVLIVVIAIVLLITQQTQPSTLTPSDIAEITRQDDSAPVPATVDSQSSGTRNQGSPLLNPCTNAPFSTLMTAAG